MAQFVGFGNGSDGVATLSGTDAPVDSSCSGTSGTRTLTIGSGLSFAAGDMVLIHQSRGTGAGNWEVKVVESYSGTTLTLTTNLDNTYTDSGSSQAQVLEGKQYSQVTISGTLTAKAWDGDVGGLLVFMCSGKTLISGTVTATGKGYRGGAQSGQGVTQGLSGEGTTGASVSQTSANGNGGGGSQGTTGNLYGGGGGGHSTAGTAGTNGSNGTPGAGGGTGGTADLTTLIFGGGGGAAGAKNESGRAGGAGGEGGANIVIFSKEIEITGSVVSNGNNGAAGSPAPGDGAGGGGGAAGSILLKAQTATLGSSLVTATGGSGNTTGDGDGGNGGNGRIAIEACVRTGTTNPAATETIGGRPWCSSVAGII